MVADGTLTVMVGGIVKGGKLDLPLGRVDVWDELNEIGKDQRLIKKFIGSRRWLLTYT